MYSSSRTREIEHTSASACDYHTTHTRIASNPDDQHAWTETPVPNETETTDHVNADADSVPVVTMAEGTTVRIAPMERKCGGWDEEHFHEALKIPDGCAVGPGMVVTLEAKARECVAIALAPKPNFTLGKTYAIHIGASYNISTVLRRRLPSQTEAVDATFSTPHICCDRTYVPYWIIFQSGRLSVGVGRTPGKFCVGTLEDEFYHQLRSGVDAVRYVGLGNSALGRNGRDVKVRRVRVMALPVCFGVCGGFVPLVSEYALDWNAGVAGGGGGGAEGGGSGEFGAMVKEDDAALWTEYQKECEKAKARAKKFGMEYKQPNPDAFFKWSEARRLRANPERGFVTGIDIMSKEEREKAGKRKERFEEEARAMRRKERFEEDGRAVRMDDVYSEGDGTMELEQEEMVEEEEMHYSLQEDKKGPLPLEQAWDNELFVREHRTDPPPFLYALQTSGDEQKDATNKTINGMDMNDADEDAAKDEINVITADDDVSTRARPALQTNDSKNENDALPVPEKIHLFAIDWAAFKQIRTDDIMAYFSVYGPSYVEWLGELSCNVLFEDKYSAARAMAAMSQGLPSPPPQSVLSSFGKHGRSRLDHSNHEENMNHGGGGGGNGETCDNVDGTSMVDNNAETRESNDVAASSDYNNLIADVPDFGRMGWRFCIQPVRKLANDRFGKRGTRSRLLMRIASSLDVLEERPTTWPKPPPGFTTKRVLGPGSDFPKRQRRRGNHHTNHKAKRRRKSGGNRWYNSKDHRSNDGGGGGDGDDGGGDEWNRGGEDSGMDYHTATSGGEHPALGRGLKSTRAGFSVEELEAERQLKANASHSKQ